MAKVTGPLFSVSASGAVGKSFVFFPLAHCPGMTPVRQWLKPQNPKTTQQGDVRVKLMAAGRAVRRVEAGSTLRTQIEDATPADQIWNSYFVTSILGSNMANVNAALTQWDGLDGGDQGLWTTAANGIPFETSSVSYADQDDITPGMALYIAAYGAYMLGLAIADSAPEGWGETEINAFADAFSA